MTLHPSLDDIDRQLIAHLIVDGRASYAKLAPAVGLSQAAVRTRVQRLIDERHIAVTGRVDPGSFGLGVFAFAFIEVALEVHKMAARIGEVEEAVFIAIASGRYDLLVDLRCADDSKLLQVMDRIRVIDGVRRIQSATVLHYDKQDWTGIGDRQAKGRPVRTPSSAPHLDETDRILLRELIADGRVTYAALGPKVGLSQAAVRDRVIDLVESNIIAVQAQPAAEAMGIAGFAGIGIRASGPVQPICQALTAMAETTLVARTLGRFDVIAEVWFEDRDHLGEILERLRPVPQIAEMDTLPHLEITKEQFGPGQHRN